ncbi:MAG: ABC transporter substrate-binding protein [Planctomycetota bacterium]
MRHLTRNSVSLVALCALALAIIFFLPACSKKDPKSEVIKIGAILPLTGESAFWGENIKNGIELAVDEINQKGGILGKKVAILYEDTQGQPAVGTQVVSKLISIHKVQCIIGDVISSVMLAVAPIMERNKCVLLGFGESAEITNAGDYIFRNWNSVASDAEITGDFAAKHSHAVVVLSQNDAFGKSAKELFVSELRKKNVKIVMDEVFSKGETDYRAILTKLQTLEYDGLYIASFHQDTLEPIRITPEWPIY